MGPDKRESLNDNLCFEPVGNIKRLIKKVRGSSHDQKSMKYLGERVKKSSKFVTEKHRLRLVTEM